MSMVEGRSSPDKVQAIDVVVVADKEAEFASFMARSTAALARTAWLLCGDTHVAEELVQQALMKTYLAWPRARKGEPLAYARRILANARIDTWRRRRREVLMASDTLPDRSSDATSPADRHAERDRLSHALLTLPTKQRRIVVLRHLEGLTEREVADATGVSVGTVKSTASRGLARLREVLQAEEAADATGTTATPPGTASPTSSIRERNGS